MICTPNLLEVGQGKKIWDGYTTRIRPGFNLVFGPVGNRVCVRAAAGTALHTSKRVLVPMYVCTFQDPSQHYPAPPPRCVEINIS